MNHLWLEGDRISKYAISQAHRQLEDDYGENGVLRQRRSNRRRGKSTKFQLHRMRFRNSLWVDIVADPIPGENLFLEQVRFIYVLNVLKMGLPHDKQVRSTMRRMLNIKWLQQFYPEILKVEVAREANCTKNKASPMFSKTLYSD